MATRLSQASKPSPAPESGSATVKETPLEAVASTCSVLVVGLFMLTFLAQNFVIPSGSMENTLLVGDHLLVDRITLHLPRAGCRWCTIANRGAETSWCSSAPPPSRSPMRKATRVPDSGQEADRIPGDRIHLRDGTVFINGVAQPAPKEGLDTPIEAPSERAYVDDFPSVLPTTLDTHGAVDPWVVDLPNHIQNGDLVVPPGKYFMMGDHRHGSLDSRFWGFVPRENIMGRPLFNYWSFKTPEDQHWKKPASATRVGWMGHVVLHFFTDTRWSRTLKRMR